MSKKQMSKRLTNMHRLWTLRRNESIDILRDHLAIFEDICHQSRVINVRYEEMSWKMLCVIAYHYGVECNRFDDNVPKLINVLRASKKIPSPVSQSISHETAVYPSPWLHSLEVSYVIQFNLHHKRWFPYRFRRSYTNALSTTQPSS